MLLTLTHYICSLNGIHSKVMCRETVARWPCNFCNLIWRIERRVGIILFFSAHNIEAWTANVTVMYKCYIENENAYYSFNWHKVTILSRLLWYYCICSLNHRIESTNYNLEQSYKPKRHVLIGDHVMNRCMNEVYLSTFWRVQKKRPCTDLICLVSLFCPWFVLYEVMSVVESGSLKNDRRWNRHRYRDKSIRWLSRSRHPDSSCNSFDTV